MTKITHNAILQLCIHQFICQLAQHAARLRKTIQQYASSYSCSLGQLPTTTYTYDSNPSPVQPLSRAVDKTAYAYALISLNAPRSLPNTSPTYAYDPLCNHTSLHHSSIYKEQTKPNNSPTCLHSLRYGNNKTTHPLYNRSPERLPHTTTYNATINPTTTHTHLLSKTHIYYYGYRYYSPELGRWLNRDPIGKRGGANLYGFVDNASTIYFDLVGLKSCKNWSPTGDTRCKYEFARWGTGIFKNYFKCYQYWEEQEEKETGTCCSGISERWVFDEEKKVSGYISSGAVIPDTPTEYCKKNHACP